jgi:hypothetical protein
MPIGADGRHHYDGTEDAAPTPDLLNLFGDSLPVTAAGSVYGGAAVTTVHFPAGRFAAPPVVIAINAENVPRGLTAVTAAGFTYQNAVGANATLYWLAIEAH